MQRLLNGFKRPERWCVLLQLIQHTHCAATYAYCHCHSLCLSSRLPPTRPDSSHSQGASSGFLKAGKIQMKAGHHTEAIRWSAPIGPAYMLTGRNRFTKGASLHCTSCQYELARLQLSCPASVLAGVGGLSASVCDYIDLYLYLYQCICESALF